MKNNRGFTLIEIMVVVAIIALLAVLTLPSIKAMQAGGARAQAYNTINAALQAARSYAIMHGINTAARFQPNGKIFIVYRVEQNSFRVCVWGANTFTPFPNNNSGTGSEQDYIYLPIIDQEPLSLPRGFAVFNANPPTNFSEPFYVCYNSSGTIVSGERISVALVSHASGNARPVNPNFAFTNNDDNLTWNDGNFSDPFNLSDWIKKIENPTNLTSKIEYRKLARFYLSPESLPEKTSILNLTSPDADYGIDHYTGFWGDTATKTATTQIGLFQTPENWDQLPLYDNTIPVADYTKTKQDLVGEPTNGIYAKQKYDTIFINPYTGRVIRPVE